MHRRIVVPNRDRRPRVEDARKRVAARPDFFGVEHPRGRSLGAKSVRGVGDQENQAERREHQAPTRSATVRKDGRGHRHGRRQARTGGQGCADPVGRVDHPNTPSAQQVERERAEERKRIEKEKLAITIRHLMLATILHHENSWRSSEFGLARTHGSFSPGILAAVCDGGEASGKAPRADLVPIAFPYLPAVSLPFALNCT